MSTPQSVPHVVGNEFSSDSVLLADGTGLLIAYSDSIQLWDLANNSLIETWDEHSMVRPSPNGELFAALSENTVVVRSLQSGDVIYTLPFVSEITDMVFSPDSRLLVMTFGYGGDYHSVIVDATNGSSIEQISNFSRPVSLAFSPNGRLLVIVESDAVSIRDVETGTLLGLVGMNWQKNDIGAVAFSGDGRLFAATHGVDIAIYMTDTGDLISFARSQTVWPGCLSFNPRNYQLASIGIHQDGYDLLDIWDIEPLLN
jgi:WD40 repeat protein